MLKHQSEFNKFNGLGKNFGFDSFILT